MKKPSYLRKYRFNGIRQIGITPAFKIYDEDSCISNAYTNLRDAEEALKKYVLKTLGMKYSTKEQLI